MEDTKHLGNDAPGYLRSELLCGPWNYLWRKIISYHHWANDSAPNCPLRSRLAIPTFHIQKLRLTRVECLLQGPRAIKSLSPRTATPISMLFTRSPQAFLLQWRLLSPQLNYKLPADNSYVLFFFINFKLPGIMIALHVSLAGLTQTSISVSLGMYSGDGAIIYDQLTLSKGDYYP